MATLITNLDQDKYNPIVVTTKEGKLSSELRKLGIEVKIIPLHPIVNKFGGQILDYFLFKKTKVLVELLKYNYKVYRWLEENEINIVYTNGIRSLLYAGLAARFRGLPLFKYIRSEGDPSFIFKFLGLKLPTKIITIADGVRSMYTDGELKKHSEKFTTLYTGFDFEKYKFSKEKKEKDKRKVRKKLDISLDSQIVGIVGSITPRKGYDLLVEVASKVTSEINDLQFMVVGNPPQEYTYFRDELKRKVKDKGMSSQFHWLGYQDDVIPFYNAIDLLVLPSRAEGLPRTVIEGLAMGLPVVATNVGGTKEIINSENLGKVIEKDNSEQLGDAILEVLNNEELFKEDKAKNRFEYVKNKFSIPNYIQGFEEIINKELNS
ncbi:glycosyltransferase family 4 protein [Fuchsiella alkaliacetigena]|uniref:glycosyltransferase family 4 protein n=1 Tax=Fuchsiella alkaliacetigena TaxID=957042 RepID=UPI00200A774A|nr:glycosyltransferase family 4 protein [Fuchsiella alkaliacetigena]MCK8824331.1 glycosyltransferase family 4 protein [Fuchsiella alkaliacetigena]